MSPTTEHAGARDATLGDVVEIWWPLSASWLLMALEVPLVSAMMARLADPTVQLAAFGGLVFPLMMIIESPVIMLLAASTALARTRTSYSRLLGYANRLAAILTVLHLLLTLTPAYHWIAREVIGAPEAIIGPARWALVVVVPWTWAIAYRRFNQGVLIRLGQTRTIGAGTLVRLLSQLAVILLILGQREILTRLGIAGVVAGTSVIIVGVLSEAFFIHIRTRPRLDSLATTGDDERALGGRAFARFYVPLALTSLIGLLAPPVGAAAMSRMPMTMESLAIWPIVFGLVFLLRSSAVAYKEVVVAMLERPNGHEPLRRFALILSGCTFAITLAVIASPLGRIWFERLSGLEPRLAAFATTALAFGALMPVVGVAQNYFVGYLVHSRQTRRITESMVIYLATCGGLLFVGASWDGAPGAYMAMIAFTIANLAQIGWVWRHSHPGLTAMRNAPEKAREPVLE